ncbi:hypothetical protein [Candidatus Clavichlamydia salmonicola]|uniref:hypothetical protein n=1 Tax=Candidatus Clavichlamydia salmonicola TaxID=469812 RepID=UPI001890F6BB|nr:hypothetical protein [Candidatus Clavichlamydia salmonicola]
MFLFPILDYEIIETRDARINLRVPGLEKGIKIAGGRGMPLKAVKEVREEKVSQPLLPPAVVEPVAIGSKEIPSKETFEEEKDTKWKDKKRYKKRKDVTESTSSEKLENDASDSIKVSTNPQKLFSLLPPPSMLISEVLRQQDEKKAGQIKEHKMEKNSDVNAVGATNVSQKDSSED